MQDLLNQLMQQQGQGGMPVEQPMPMMPQGMQQTQQPQSQQQPMLLQHLMSQLSNGQ